jgi:predicted transcriptional regulator of viral defense system
MAGKIDNYIDSLTAEGKISFVLNDLCSALSISRKAGLTAIARLKSQKKVVSPSKGYYLILTPEFRNKGCLPADFFIDDLMHHLKTGYYVSLLSAAVYYGAAHQQPQMLQVTIPDKMRNIQCNKVSIEFIKNIHYDQTPIKQFNTRTGYINVSTPEGTAMDMMKYMRQSGGLNRIATVLDELADVMDVSVLKQLTQKSKEYVWKHRLGFILEKLEKFELANTLYETINKNCIAIIPLVPYDPIKRAPRDKKWKIAINAVIQSDLDDTY